MRCRIHKIEERKNIHTFRGIGNRKIHTHARSIYIYIYTMSWQKIVAQVVITGSQIIGKAFLTAYRQAAANAGKDAVKAAGGVVRRGQMTESEALEILNVKKLPDGDLPPREELEAYYVKYFEANDPKNGGSYYLQSKFFRANEFLQEQHDINDAENNDDSNNNNETDSSSSSMKNNDQEEMKKTNI